MSYDGAVINLVLLNFNHYYQNNLTLVSNSIPDNNSNENNNNNNNNNNYFTSICIIIFKMTVHEQNDFVRNHYNFHNVFLIL